MASHRLPPQQKGNGPPFNLDNLGCSTCRVALEDRSDGRAYVTAVSSSAACARSRAACSELSAPASRRAPRELDHQPRRAMNAAPSETALCRKGPSKPFRLLLSRWHWTAADRLAICSSSLVIRSSSPVANSWRSAIAARTSGRVFHFAARTSGRFNRGRSRRTACVGFSPATMQSTKRRSTGRSFR